MQAWNDYTTASPRLVETQPAPLPLPTQSWLLAHPPRSGHSLPQHTPLVDDVPLLGKSLEKQEEVLRWREASTWSTSNFFVCKRLLLCSLD